MSNSPSVPIMLAGVVETESSTEKDADSNLKHSSQNVSHSHTTSTRQQNESKSEEEGNRSKSAVKSQSGSKYGNNGSNQKDDIPLLDQKSLLLAATLVLDAKSGRNLTFKTEEKFIRSYILYNKFFLRYLLYFFIFFDLSLAVFEKPAVSGADLPYYVTMIFEFLCLVFFVTRVVHSFHFQESGVFWRDTKNYMVLVAILLTVIDMIVYAIWINVSPDTHPVRWSRPLRPLFIINFSDGKQIRRAFRNIRRTVPDIMNVLVLFMVNVLLFGLLAYKLFYKKDILQYANGEPYFKQYWDSVWDLYILVTTANNPDVMMPAYDYNNWYALFFIIYLIISLYIFMSIVLAAIYNNYKKNLKNEIRTSVFSKRQKLLKAFEILKVDFGEITALSPNRWTQLMSVVAPTRSATQVDLLRRVLDTDGDGYITKAQFLNLNDLLHVKLTEVTDRVSLLERLIPRVYNSAVSQFIKFVVKHRFFRYSFDFLIFVNSFFIGFDIDQADWFFLIAFMLEIILKLYVYGAEHFFSRFWNVFDLFVIGAAFITTIVEAIVGDKVSQEFNTLDILLVLRVLRLFKLFGSIQRFRIIIQTIINIGPSIITYGGVMFVFYYFFAIIGMELFQGLISYHGYNLTATAPEDLWCGNSQLQNSTFFAMRYCSNNFNHIFKAFVLLTELTVVNQWHVLSSGFVYVTSKAARLYFFAFHLCCVVLVLNIFTAFILEAFILEYSLQGAPKLESAVEAKIKQFGLGTDKKDKPFYSTRGDETELVMEEELPENSRKPSNKVLVNHEDSESDTDSIQDVPGEPGLRFHLKKRKHKKVEVLLQQMFQSEIGADEAGPEGLSESTQIIIPTRKLTLETV